MDIHDLLQSLTLVDVRTIESSASLSLDGGEGAGLASFGGAEPSGGISISLNPVAWGQRIETWFRAEVGGQGFKLATAVAVIYDRATDEPIDKEVQVEFLEKIAIMAAFPYLRAQVQALASELRIGTITLDVLRQGQFKVEGPGDTSQKEGADGP